MTERQIDREAALNEQDEQQRLSTADMAAVEQRDLGQARLKDIEADAVPVEAEAQSAPATPEHESAEAPPVQLLNADATQTFRSRWTSIQTGFVDEPRRAVEQADSLVAEVMQHLAKTFADERTKLEGQWGRGDNVSTEELRVALQRYRSFFDRLLSM
jgi:hypothetical protein